MTERLYQIRGARASDIATSVETGLRDGKLRPGERLPTVRALAERLGVSPVTVASAYNTLKSRGLITADGRRGTRIALRPPIALRAWAGTPEGLVDLAGGNPDPALLPSFERALVSLPTRSRLYGESPAMPALVEEAIEAFAADGVPAEAVTVTNGALDTIERVLLAHRAPGDRVAVEDPGFLRIFDLVAALGMTPDPVRLDDRGIVPASLNAAIARGARALIVTPRAQNPTGAAFDAKRARELRGVLRKAPDVLVIEDDHAGAVCGADHETIVEPGRAHWAVVRSFSKSLGPDVRAAVLAGDDTTIARVEGRLAAGAGWVSYMLQHLVVGLLRDPSTQRVLRNATKAYERRRNALLDALSAEGVHARGASGMNVFVPVPDEQRVVQALAREGFGIRAGEPFRLEAPPFVRVTISTLDPKDAKIVAGHIARALRPSRASYSA